MYMIDVYNFLTNSIEFKTLAYTSILTGAIWVIITGELDISYIFNAHYWDITNTALSPSGKCNDYMDLGIYADSDRSDHPETIDQTPHNCEKILNDGNNSYEFKHIHAGRRSLQVLGKGCFKILYIVGAGKIAAAITSTGGVYIGFLVAKHVVGSPWVKCLAGFTTVLATQALYFSTYKLMRIYGSVDFDNIDLNLLSDINTLLSFCCILMGIIAVIYISKYMFHNKLPRFFYKKNIFTNCFSYWLSNYLNLWSKMSNRFIGICFFLILLLTLYCSFSLEFLIDNVNIDTLCLTKYEYIDNFKLLLFVYYLLIFCIIILFIMFIMYFLLYIRDNSILNLVNNYKLIRLIFEYSAKKDNKFLIIYIILFISIYLCKILMLFFI